MLIAHRETLDFRNFNKMKLNLRLKMKQTGLIPQDTGIGSLKFKIITLIKYR
jgi:hypothetical protein